MGGNWSIASVAGGDEDSDEFPMHVVTRFRVRPGAGERLKAVVAERRLLDRTRDADGCRFVVMLQQTEDPLGYAVIEVFSAYETLRAHAQSPLVKEFSDAVGPLLDGALARDVYLPIAEQNQFSYASAGVFGGSKRAQDSVFCLTEFESQHVAAATEVKTSMEDAHFVESSRREPGVLYFTFAQHIEAKRRFTIVEEYKDLAAFDAHTDAPHMKEAIERLHPHITGQPKHTTFQRAM